MRACERASDAPEEKEEPLRYNCFSIFLIMRSSVRGAKPERQRLGEGRRQRSDRSQNSCRERLQKGRVVCGAAVPSARDRSLDAGGGHARQSDVQQARCKSQGAPALADDSQGRRQGARRITEEAPPPAPVPTRSAWKAWTTRSSPSSTSIPIRGAVPTSSHLANTGTA